MIQIMLLPHPPHPDAGASHPHPQFVAAKSLMLIPPELSLHFQYMLHGMSDFLSEDEKCCSSFPAEAVAEGKNSIWTERECTFAASCGMMGK